jgi:hypothetical protein
MNTRQLIARLALTAATAVIAPAVQAQDIWASNRAFDQRMNQWLSNAQQQNTNSMNQIWQQHLTQNGPRLQQQYRQMLGSGNRSMTYEQFAYWDLVTAAGTNIAGARQAQMDQYNGLRRAHDIVQEGNRDYNTGSAINSARTSAALANYGNGAIRGVAPYVDSRSGATQMLPYGLPAGQLYQSGGESYVRDQSGTYYRWAGNAWAPMQQGR